MGRRIETRVLVYVVIAWLAHPAPLVFAAEPPPGVSGEPKIVVPFQAELTDAANAPRAGTFPITFAIYTAKTGGTRCWEEHHPAASVDGGRLNVLLGQITSLSASIIGVADGACGGKGARYLGITVGNAGQEMYPRHELVPAFHARTSEWAGAVADGVVGSTEIADGSIKNADLDANVGKTVSTWGTKVVAGEVIAAGNAVCLVDSPGSAAFRVFRCDSAVDERNGSFVGIATQAANSSDSPDVIPDHVEYVAAGLVSLFTGLEAGVEYYLASPADGMGYGPGGVTKFPSDPDAVFVGTAVSDTTLLVDAGVGRRFVAPPMQLFAEDFEEGDPLIFNNWAGTAFGTATVNFQENRSIGPSHQPGLGAGGGAWNVFRVEQGPHAEGKYGHLRAWDDTTLMVTTPLRRCTSVVQSDCYQSRERFTLEFDAVAEVQNSSVRTSYAALWFNFDHAQDEPQGEGLRLQWRVSNQDVAGGGVYLEVHCDCDNGRHPSTNFCVDTELARQKVASYTDFYSGGAHSGRWRVKMQRDGDVLRFKTWWFLTGGTEPTEWLRTVDVSSCGNGGPYASVTAVASGSRQFEQTNVWLDNVTITNR